MRTASPPTANHAYRAGALAFIGALAVILVALGFEYFGGYKPCPLCLQQRYAYYVAIPVLFVALSLYASGRLTASALLFLLVSFAFVANAMLGIYHAGAEWKFWPGPDTCSAALQPLSPAGGGLLKQLEAVRVVRCDEAQWRFAGLSFAGWNVVNSFLIFTAALQAAFASARR